MRRFIGTEKRLPSYPPTTGLIPFSPGDNQKHYDYFCYRYSYVFLNTFTVVSATVIATVVFVVPRLKQPGLLFCRPTL